MEPGADESRNVSASGRSYFKVRFLRESEMRVRTLIDGEAGGTGNAATFCGHDDLAGRGSGGNGRGDFGIGDHRERRRYTVDGHLRGLSQASAVECHYSSDWTARGREAFVGRRDPVACGGGEHGRSRGDGDIAG